MATYFKGLYACNLDHPSEKEGCSPYSRLNVDTFACYDSEYASCVDDYHANLTQTLTNIYTVIRECHKLPCLLGDTECTSSSDERKCFENEFPGLVEAVDQCPSECNLLAACGGGGFDCVTNEDECKACMQALE